MVACIVLFMGMVATAGTQEEQIIQTSEETEITRVLVPTKLTAAFNPYGYGVRKANAVVYDQVISGNYGILNLSTKDKLVWIDISIEDNNNAIIFVETEEAVRQAGSEQFVVYLEVVTGMLKDVLTEESTGNDLLNVELWEEGRHSIVVTDKGARIGFKLKGTANRYENVMELLMEMPENTVSGGDSTVSGGDATVSDGNATVLSKDLKTVCLTDEIAQDNYRGFTIRGAMNRNAEWSRLAAPITIRVDYQIEEVGAVFSQCEYGFLKID